MEKLRELAVVGLLVAACGGGGTAPPIDESGAAGGSHAATGGHAPSSSSGGALDAGAGGAQDGAGRLCIPGQSVSCVGPGGCKGGQACASDGQSFGDCECASALGAGGARGSGGASAMGGTSADDAGDSAGGKSVAGVCPTGQVVYQNRCCTRRKCVDLGSIPICGNASDDCGGFLACGDVCPPGGECVPNTTTCTCWISPMNNCSDGMHRYLCDGGHTPKLVPTIQGCIPNPYEASDISWCCPPG